ncbi:MAG: site-2 protease family protein [Deltaproteobacteria bacterium]|nr:site-2 protease family protein [Deltaproteobacteria bacterium]
MIQLLYNGQFALFFLIIIALVISLSFHEYGHALVAKLFGDDTAQRMGRLTLNPMAHIDAMGLLMVVLVGFGFAKPVPTNPRNFNSKWADLFVSSAGPAMNFLLALVSVNFFLFSRKIGIEWMDGEGQSTFFIYLAQINLILMIFNLIPIGPLDGHYIMPYLLTPKMGAYYTYYNLRYGSMALMGFVLLSMVGVPVFSFVWRIGAGLLQFIIFV